jgi:acyl-CoA thioesterase
VESIEAVVHRDAFAKLAGIELLEIRAGFARARMAIRPEHLNGLGLVHGGAIFTLADLTFAAACNSHGPPTVAVNVSISFLKAAKAGTLFAECTELTPPARLGSYAARVTDEAGETIATFQGLSYRKSTGSSASDK